MSYDNTNKGAIFNNQYKKTQSHPDKTGQAEIVCPCCGKTTKFRLSAWFNNKVNGMLSINFLEDSKIEKKTYPHQKAPQQRDDVPDRYKFNKTPVQADPPYSDDDGSDVDNMPF